MLQVLRAEAGRFAPGMMPIGVAGAGVKSAFRHSSRSGAQSSQSQPAAASGTATTANGVGVTADVMVADEPPGRLAVVTRAKAWMAGLHPQ